MEDGIPLGACSGKSLSLENSLWDAGGDGAGGDHGGDLAGNHEGSTVDHTRVRDLVEHELAGLATTGAMSSSDTESL